MVIIYYICRTKKLNDMKKFGILMMAAVALTAASCSSEAETEENEEGKVEAVTYTLDKANSSIKWKGQMSAEYFHLGTVDVSEGSMTVEGEDISGSFTVDMNSIKNTDLPEGKADYLVGHLRGTMPDEDHPVNMFFNTPEFPSVGVTIGDYSDGKLDLTLNILGKQIEQTVNATVASNESGASIKGAITLDLSSLGAPGFGVQADGSQVSPLIEFDIAIALKK